MRRPGPADVLTLVAVCALWGSTFVAIKFALVGLDAMGIAGARTGGAALLVAGVVALTARRWPSGREGLTRAVIIGGVGLAIPFTLVAWAERHLGAADTGVLFGLGPLLALVVSHFMSRDDRFGPRKLLGLSVGFVGGALAASAAGQAADTRFGWLAVGAVLTSALCFAIAGNLVRRAPAEEVDGHTAVGLAVAAVSLGFAEMLFGAPPTPELGTLPVLGALAWLAVGPTALGYVIRYRQAAAFGYTFVSFAGYLVPVFATLWAVLLLGERPPGLLFVGLGITLVGLHLSRAAPAATEVARA